MLTAHGSRLYVDDASWRAIQSGSNASRVLLLGGFLGYANFGDIAQAKGAIDWHRQHTGLEPILVCSTDAILGDSFPAQVRSWMNVDAVVFVAPEAADLSFVGLSPLPPAEVPFLQMYGGGALNRYWGADMLSTTELLIDHFAVQHLVISGQQVDPEFADEFADFVRRASPAIVGCRDHASVRCMVERGVDARYSFDDAWEVLDEFVTRSPNLPMSQDSTGTVLVHLNVSSYNYSDEGRMPASVGDASSPPRHGVERALDEIRSIVNSITSLTQEWEDLYKVTLVQGYTDRRVLDVVDSLGVVQQLEMDFPIETYRVLHLDKSMLSFQPGSTDPVVSLPRGSAITVSASYHVSMLSCRLGIPCWLKAENAYYDQKRQGLGLPEMPLDEFLAAPTTTDLADQATGRNEWLLELHGIYGDALAGVEPVGTEPAPLAPSSSNLRADDMTALPVGSIKPFPLATHEEDRRALLVAVEWERSQHASWQSEAQRLQLQIDDMKDWIDQLHASKEYHEEQHHLLRRRLDDSGST